MIESRGSGVTLRLVETSTLPLKKLCDLRKVAAPPRKLRFPYLKVGTRTVSAP